MCFGGEGEGCACESGADEAREKMFQEKKVRNGVISAADVETSILRYWLTSPRPKYEHVIGTPGKSGDVADFVQSIETLFSVGKFFLAQSLSHSFFGDLRTGLLERGNRHV